MVTNTLIPNLVAVADSLTNVAALEELIADLEGARSPVTADFPVDAQTPSLVAIIVLTGPASTASQWLQRLVGAVSVTPKPIRLTAAERISSGCKLPGSAPSAQLQMDLDSTNVRVLDREVALTHQEFLLLKSFLQNPNRTFSRGQLLDLAWDVSEWGSGRTVDVHVRRLRVKLGPVASWIVTVRGFGYRFTPENNDFSVVGTG